jgi:hypothetical protein
MSTKPTPPPSKAGLYWAKFEQSEWFNMIAEVSGEAPFFRIVGWSMTTNKLGAVHPSHITEWGPEIARP